MNMLWKVLRNELAPGVCALSLDILGQLLLALLQGFQLLLLILKLHRFRGPHHGFLICSQTLISLLFLSPQVRIYVIVLDITLITLSK